MNISVSETEIRKYSKVIGMVYDYVYDYSSYELN